MIIAPDLKMCVVFQRGLWSHWLTLFSPVCNDCLLSSLQEWLQLAQPRHWNTLIDTEKYTLWCCQKYNNNYTGNKITKGFFFFYFHLACPTLFHALSSKVWVSFWVPVALQVPFVVSLWHHCIWRHLVQS